MRRKLTPCPLSVLSRLSLMMNGALERNQRNRIRRAFGPRIDPSIRK
jgi:hypothetical protein